MNLVVNVPETVLNKPVIERNITEGGGVSWKVPRNKSHVLHTASDLCFRESKLDVLRCKSNCFQPRGAHLVDGDGFAGGGEPCTNNSLTGRRLAYVALEDIAKVDICNFVLGDFGTFECGLDDVRTKCGCGSICEGPVELCGCKYLVSSTDAI